MKRPIDLDSIEAEARRRSGRGEFIGYPVDAVGTEIILCRLNDDDHRAFINGILSGDKGVRATSRDVALASARLWPEQGALLAACEAVPGLSDKLVQQIERLGGGANEFLRVVDVTPTLDDSAITLLGIDPGVVRSLRITYPNEGQLKITSYRDDDLSISWACVLRLPNSRAYDLMLEGLNQRGHEVVTTIAINCMAWPERESAASFVRGEYRIAPCLWPTIYAWGQMAANARPTIYRPRLTPSKTSTEAQISSEKSSEISG